MNIEAIIEGLIWVGRHRKEIASDAECGVHFIRRVEHLLVKHKTTADTILAGRRPGLFLLRDSSTCLGDYVLSVRWVTGGKGNVRGRKEVGGEEGEHDHK